jgi:hypothetical protein
MGRLLCLDRSISLDFNSPLIKKAKNVPARLRLISIFISIGYDFHKRHNGQKVNTLTLGIGLVVPKGLCKAGQGLLTKSTINCKHF